MNDSGVYRCIARNEKGVSMATVNLEVYGKKYGMKLDQTFSNIIDFKQREQEEPDGPLVGK